MYKRMLAHKEMHFEDKSGRRRRECVRAEACGFGGC